MSKIIKLRKRPGGWFIAHGFLKGTTSCYNCNFLPELDQNEDFGNDWNGPIPHRVIGAINDIFTSGNQSAANKFPTFKSEENTILSETRVADRTVLSPFSKSFSWGDWGRGHQRFFGVLYRTPCLQSRKTPSKTKKQNEQNERKKYAKYKK